MESREKVIRLFQYIAELNKMRSKNVTDFNASNSYEWKLFLSDIPESPKWISLSYKDVEGEDASDVILSVRKPDLPICPAPADILKDWLHRGYDDALFQGELLIMKKPKSDRPDETEFEYFGDVPVDVQNKFKKDPSEYYILENLKTHDSNLLVRKIQERFPKFEIDIQNKV